MLDYALDLRNFHQGSHDKLIVPMLVATEAPEISQGFCVQDRIYVPIKCNASNIWQKMQACADESSEPPFDYLHWEQAKYLPTPTIVEAAQALYRGHHVRDITRSDAGASNLSTTTDAINAVIEASKRENRKSICFVTGVPGAGKTLVGLNIAVQRSDAQRGEHAVFLSGNYPLVTVLQEALARDRASQEGPGNQRVTKKAALRSTSSFVQIIHRYRDSFVGNACPPPERIAIFDEAQRAWTREYIKQFMQTKKNVYDFDYSEPEFLIGTMERHQGWAVIICLVGGGQEINTGEAGLPEWFDSLRRAFPHWDVYLPSQLNDSEYHRGRDWKEMLHGLRVFERDELHLALSLRSFRTPKLAAFVKALLDVRTQDAQCLYHQIKDKYPLVLTRDLDVAKRWVRGQSRGTTRYGLLASSGGLRLKPEGIFVKSKASVENWFLNGKDDVRSSYALEDVATEFDIQGLELDYALLAWDADLRFSRGKWCYHHFRGNQWHHVCQHEAQQYLLNAYRVLLTRARQGMVIFVPKGSEEDRTRKPDYYDETYQYLKQMGMEVLA